MALSHSKGRVDRAGEGLRVLATSDAFDRELLLGHLQVVRDFRSDHARPLTRVAAGLRYYVDQECAGAQYRIGQRLKRLPTILDKLAREPGMDLSRMQDVGGCRAIVPSQKVIDEIVTRLRRRWTVLRVYEYYDGGSPGPKHDGYRATHVIVRKDECRIEIQLRTTLQHQWAQLVERLDLEHGLHIKEHRAPAPVVERLAGASDVMAKYDRGVITRDVLIERLTEVLHVEQ